MSVSNHHSQKSPSQNPTEFYKGKDQGGAQGSPQNVPTQLKGGPMREKIGGNVKSK